jgi:hypothetical protein
VARTTHRQVVAAILTRSFTGERVVRIQEGYIAEVASGKCALMHVDGNIW